MLENLTRNWWAFAIRGIAAILFGIMAFAWPDKTLVVLVWLFGGYMLVDGLAGLFAFVVGDPAVRRGGWAVIVSSILSIALGIASFVWTDTVALSLLYVVAFWAIVGGVLQVIGAIQLRREIDGEFWLGLSGISSVIFGVLLIAFPAGGLISLVWLVAFWALVAGVSNLGLAYRLRELNHDLKHVGMTA